MSIVGTDLHLDYLDLLLAVSRPYYFEVIQGTEEQYTRDKQEHAEAANERGCFKVYLFALFTWTKIRLHTIGVGAISIKNSILRLARNSVIHPQLVDLLAAVRGALRLRRAYRSVLAVKRLFFVPIEHYIRHLLSLANSEFLRLFLQSYVGNGEGSLLKHNHLPVLFKKVNDSGEVFDLRVYYSILSCLVE